MAQSGELATSGVLYGANFEEWRERTMAALRIQGLDIYVKEEAALTSSFAAKETWQEKSTTVAAFISMLVTPDITLRVPACERSNAKLLMQSLTAMCEHFRFLDLPAELRNRIYRFVLLGRDQDGRYPSITKVSHQIREEVLPMFYASTAFTFDSGVKGFEAHVRAWMNAIVRSNAKYLQNIAVRVSMRTMRSEESTKHRIRLTCDTQEGLRVRYPEALTLESKNLVDGFVQEVKDAATTLRVPRDGRLLLLALILRSGLWRPHVLSLR